MNYKMLSKDGNRTRRDSFMTNDEMIEIDDYLCKITQNRGHMGDLYSRWEKEEEAYKGDQPEKQDRPNSRVNIFNANIEGQIAALIDQNMTVTTRGEGPSDQLYAEWARIGLDWTLRKNKIKSIIAQHERRRLKHGNGVFNVYFDDNALNGFGLAKISCTPLTRIFIDNKIKDILRYQEAEYIAEAIRLSDNQFKDLYGENKASSIIYGTPWIEDTTTFNEEHTQDDNNAATLIRWWCRYDGKLRLMEFSACGLLLYDSHKEGNRKDNQKNKKYNHVSYYKYTANKYPYFFTSLYPVEGSIWGFGDGKLLMPLQTMLNDLYDKIRLCARPNLILFDVNSEIDLEDLDDNSLTPRPFQGATGNRPVESVPVGQVNEGWWRLLNAMHDESQRITRFSYLMLGQGQQTETATEASIQYQQGTSGVDFKKNTLQGTLVDVCEYCLGLMMQFYKGAKSFRITEREDKFEWIDFRKLANVPVMKPATEAFKKEYVSNNPEGNSPEWELLQDKNGNPLTKNVDLDIEINIGAGLPKNKVFLWQMLERLSQMQSVDSTGQSKPVVKYEELRDFIKDYLGLPLKDDEIKNMLANPIPNMPMQQPQGLNPSSTTQSQQDIIQNPQAMDSRYNPGAAFVPKTGGDAFGYNPMR